MIRCQHIQHLTTEQTIKHHENGSHTHAPHEHALYRTADSIHIPPSDEFARQSLSGVGETIRKIGENHHELHKYRADSQHHIAITGRDDSDARINRHDAH